jgi:hypothetical protein
MKFPKYKENLRREDDKIYSYVTHVATIDNDVLVVHGHWSRITTKHVNYVARYLNLNITYNELDKLQRSVSRELAQ